MSYFFRVNHLENYVCDGEKIKSSVAWQYEILTNYFSSLFCNHDYIISLILLDFGLGIHTYKPPVKKSFVYRELFSLLLHDLPR
jgi:hypothetical protein